MYIIPIAWLYVAVMMAVAEATNHNGSVLGAAITFVLYGLGPVLLVLYLMGAPTRRKVNKAKEDLIWQMAQDQARAQGQTNPSVAPDGSGHATAPSHGNAVTPVRKET